MHPRTVARRAAVQTLAGLERTERVSNLSFQDVPPEALGFAREIASGALRHRARLDALLVPLLRRPLSKLDAPVRAALRLAAYERAFLQTPAHGVADDYAGLMRGLKLSSAVALVNAVARRLPAALPALPPNLGEAARLALEFSHPQWLVERWLKRFGLEECQALLQADNQIAPLSLRVNTRRATREAVLQRLQHQGLQHQGLQAMKSEIAPDAIRVQNAGSPLDWDVWREGLIVAQDEAAQLVGVLAAPEAGSLVVDACSAPGGKTTHLAQSMDDQGRVIACDLAPGRLKLVRDNAQRLGLNGIETREGDFRVLSADLPPADLVLLDAPCLGTGTLRRRPDAKWRKTTAQLEELVELQRALLDCAARVVKTNGILVYSTCSLESEENETQARAFGVRHPEFVLEIPSDEQLQRFVTPEGGLQTLPQRDGCDGMFAARWRRISGA